jgi:aldehyde dehydrogenase (NAD+)
MSASTTSGGEARMLIDGVLVSASDGGTHEDVNPATEEVLGVAADAIPADLDRAVTAARQAFDGTWLVDLEVEAQLLGAWYRPVRRAAPG